MNKNTDSNGKRKIGSRASYLLYTVIAVVLAVIAWQVVKYKIANRKITSTVDEKSKGLYSIHYDSLAIDEILGALHVKNVQVIPDTAVYNQMVTEGKNPAVIMRITIPSLDLLRIKTPKALLTKQVEGGRIEISNPSIDIEFNDFFKDSSTYHPGMELYKQLLGKLLRIAVDSIDIIHASLVVRDMKSKSIRFKGENVSLLLTDLLIDSAHKDDSSRILFSRNIDISCDRLLLPSKSKEYLLNVEKLQFISQSNSFFIGRIRLLPQLGEEAFAKAAVLQKDRYDLDLQGIGLLHIRRESLWHKKIEAEDLVVDKSSLKIYRDLSYPKDTLSRVGKYPQQMLMHLPVPVLVNKVILAESFIEYKEKNSKSNEAGKLQFYKVHAVINHVTNIKSVIANDNACVVNFNARLLNLAPMHARLTMYLADPKGRFYIQGSLGALDAPSLNPLTRPMALANINKGHVSSVVFDFSGTDSASEGKLTMKYEHLNISLLKKDKEKDVYNKKLLPSFAANVLIKNDNPGSKNELRVANMHYKRDTNKSFFNLLWKSVFTGVKQNVGIK